MPTADLIVGQQIIIRSEADSTAINSGTGNLIYAGNTPAQNLTISQASCRQFYLAQISPNYLWIIISTS